MANLARVIRLACYALIGLLIGAYSSFASADTYARTWWFYKGTDTSIKLTKEEAAQYTSVQIGLNPYPGATWTTEDDFAARYNFTGMPYLGTFAVNKTWSVCIRWPLSRNWQRKKNVLFFIQVFQNLPLTGPRLTLRNGWNAQTVQSLLLMNVSGYFLALDSLKFLTF